MAERDDFLYEAFGRLVALHRKRIQGLTQAKLGDAVGLSRTSITNIEKGRQHVSLHQLFGLARALKISPHSLLPAPANVNEASWLAEKMPPGTDPEVLSWAASLVVKDGK
ncbi:MAG: helix-turn-helix transcriptional regulator [Albidovulum sp.]|nr:helix-turn-helix transcriptional regulator [Albidovulum sp.]